MPDMARRSLMEFSDDELRDQLHKEMEHLGGWGYAAVFAEINRRSVESQAREANRLAADIRGLTDQIRWLTWAILLIGVIATAAAILALTQ